MLWERAVHHHWTPLIALHAAGATFALMVGLVVLRTPRKGNRMHRRLGLVWMASMYWTVISSFFVKELHPGHYSWIHGLSLWTLFSLTMALWAALTSRREQHRAWVIGSYCGLVGAGLAAMAFPTRLAPQLLLHRPIVFTAAFVTLAVLTAAVAWIARRPRRRAGRTDRPAGRSSAASLAATRIGPWLPVVATVPLVVVASGIERQRKRKDERGAGEA